MSERSRSRLAPRPKLIALCVASCFGGTVAFANPVGPAVVHGQASFSSAGGTLTVTNSPSAVIHWQGFSIGAGEATRFLQQSAASAVLNRVVGQDPSSILGTLWSNGRVFLVNPNGIVFGAGSRVDVAGLVASTLNIADTDFLAGRLNFQAGAVANPVVNQGAISAANGGYVYLVAPDVQNHGIISSPGGEVILAAGRSVKLVEADVPNLRVELQAGGEALNVGQILTDGGRAGIYAGLITQRGIVRADSVSRDATGQIVFRASGTTLLEGGSVTSASGAKGGTIQLLGERVGLMGDALVDASGAEGGGTVLVGGGLQGKNPDVPNALGTYIGADAVIRADANGTGDGGKVIVWSDEATRTYGVISARGGPLGGDGGFVETSGRYLEVTRAPDLVAPRGRGGTWLLDPFNIDVVAGSGVVNNGGAPSFTPSGSNSQIGADLVKGQLDSGVNVTLDTTGGGLDAGNITVVSGGGFTTTPSAPVTLTMKAHNDIVINDSIQQLAGSPLSLVLMADQDGLGGGSVTITPPAPFAPVVVNVGGDITVSGANFNVLGGTNSAVTVTAGRDLIVGNHPDLGGGLPELTGTLSVKGGTTTNGNASATLQANRDVYVKAGAVEVRGGSAFASATDGQIETATADALLAAANDIRIVTTPGGLTVAGGSARALASCCSSSNSARASANATLRAGNNISLSVAGGMIVSGGDFASASAFSFSGASFNAATASANAKVEAVAGALTVDAASLEVRGGDNAFASASVGGPNTAVVEANATLLAAGSMTLTIGAGGVVVRGGDNAYAYASSGTTGLTTATVSANALVSAGGALTVTVAGGGLTVRGGNAALASNSSGDGSVGAVVNVNASVLANSMNLTVTGPVDIRGGNNASATGSCCQSSTARNTATVNANALVRAAGDLTLTVNGGGQLTVAGGDSARAEGSEFSGAERIVTVNTNSELSAGGNLTVTMNGGGGITVRGGNNANASASASSSGRIMVSTVNARGKMAADGGNLTVTTSGALNVWGGSSASASANGSSSPTRATSIVDASALVSAGGAMQITALGGMDVRGGVGDPTARAVDLGQNRAETNVSATVTAGGALTITGGTLDVRGGVDASGFARTSSASNTAIVNANALVRSGGALVVNATRINVWGGAGAAGSGFSGAHTVSVTADASLIAGTTANLTITGPVEVLGGNNAFASADRLAGGGTTVSANATLSAGGLLTLSGTSLTVAGGAGTEADVFGGIGIASRATTNAVVLGTGGASLSFSGPLAVRGGDGVRGLGWFSGSNNTATAEASASLVSGAALTVTAGSLAVSGGNQGSSSARNMGSNAAVTTRSNAVVSAVGDFSYAGGSVTLSGGVANAQADVAPFAARSEANADLLAGGTKTLAVTGSLSLMGGQASGLLNGAAFASAIVDPGAVTIGTTGDLSLTGGTVVGTGLAYAALTTTGTVALSVGGPVGLTLTGGTGALFSTGVAAGIVPVFTGGGSQTIVANPLLDAALVQGLGSPPLLAASPSSEASEASVLPDFLIPLLNAAINATVRGGGNVSAVTVDATGPPGSGGEETDRKRPPKCQ